LISKRAVVVGKVVISVGLLVALFIAADPASVFDRLRNIDLVYFGIGAALLLLQLVLSSLKWRLILRADGHSESFLRLMRTYLIGNFLSLFLPTSFGGDVYRGAVLSKRLRVAKGTASVLFDRLTGVLALFTVALVGLTLVADSVVVSMLAAAGIALGIVGFVAVTSQTATEWLDRRADRRVVAFVAQLLTSFRTYRRHRQTVVLALLISLTFQVNTVIINYCYVQALGLDVPFATLVLVIPLAYATEVIPVSINGIGVRDTALVTLLGFFGFPADYGVALGLLIIAGRYLMGSMGGVALVFTLMSQRRSVSSAP
jgi:uncharacterized protein (TIRG00374 family)